MKYTCTIEINLPLNKVVELWSNEAYFKHWQDGFQSLAEVPFEDQIKFMNSISDFEEYRRQLRSQTQEFYLDSNYTLLKSFYDEKFPFMVDYKETLVAKKHKDWAEKLSAGMDTSSCFISLDVTHLVGEDNLIDKLLSKGYKVSKIQ